MMKLEEREEKEEEERSGIPKKIDEVLQDEGDR